MLFAPRRDRQRSRTSMLSLAECKLGGAALDPEAADLR
jgi:hypothetical protein